MEALLWSLIKTKANKKSILINVKLKEKKSTYEQL